MISQCTHGRAQNSQICFGDSIRFDPSQIHRCETRVTRASRSSCFYDLIRFLIWDMLTDARRGDEGIGIDEIIEDEALAGAPENKKPRDHVHRVEDGGTEETPNGHLIESDVKMSVSALLQCALRRLKLHSNRRECSSCVDQDTAVR